MVVMQTNEVVHWSIRSSRELLSGLRRGTNGQEQLRPIVGGSEFSRTQQARFKVHERVLSCEAEALAPHLVPEHPGTDLNGSPDNPTSQSLARRFSTLARSLRTYISCALMRGS